MKFPNLFSEIEINGMKLKNRIVMTATHLGYATTEGEVNDRLVAFYLERAKGGVGLIIVGGCPVDDHVSMANMIRMDDDRYLPGLKRLTKTVKATGVKMGVQIYQAGRYVHSTMIGGRKPVSASAVRSKLTGEIPDALDIEEIRKVQDRFARAALRVKEAGFDAVEIHGSAGYLVSQFLSPLTNLREDIYGGSVENRMRFGIELVEKIRKAVGPDFPIMMRLAGNEFMEGGNALKEAALFAEELEKAGVDLFNVTVGWHESRVPQLTTFVPRSCLVYAAQWLKSAVSAPVLACNRINDPLLAENILQEGSADLIAMTRALIADPDLPNKALEGREDLIVHCVACNQGCFDNIFKSKQATCLVNPRAGMERELSINHSDKVKKVLVIGGGPAGMKAANIAAQRGHKVTLAERSGVLGGQLQLNRNIPGRKELVTVVKDLESHIKAQHVDILLNRTVDREFIQKTAPDVAILATGARPLVPEIGGVGSGSPQVILAWDVLANGERVGKRVVVVGGNAVGLETALYLASQGTISPEVLHFLAVNRAEPWDVLEKLISRGNKQVTVVEMTGQVGKDIGSSTRWNVLAELKRLGVKILTGAKALALNSMGLEIQKDSGNEILPADSVIMATGSESENRLLGDMEDLVSSIYVIGDAKEPRNALEAIKEGFQAGLNA